MAFHVVPACIFASSFVALAVLSYFHLQQPQSLLWYSQTGVLILVEWVSNKGLVKYFTHSSGIPRNTESTPRMQAAYFAVYTAAFRHIHTLHCSISCTHYIPLLHTHLSL